MDTDEHEWDGEKLSSALVPGATHPVVNHFSQPKARFLPLGICVHLWLK